MNKGVIIEHIYHHIATPNELTHLLINNSFTEIQPEITCLPREVFISHDIVLPKTWTWILSSLWVWHQFIGNIGDRGTTGKIQTMRNSSEQMTQGFFLAVYIYVCAYDYVCDYVPMIFCVCAYVWLRVCVLLPFYYEKNRCRMDLYVKRELGDM